MNCMIHRWLQSGVWALALIIALGSGTAAASTIGRIGCRVEADRSVLPAGGPQTVVVKVTLDAKALPASHVRPQVNLGLVMDRSGSMSGMKIEKAREAALEALGRLGTGDLFSLVVYDHQVDTLVPAQSARYTEGIASRIRGIRPGGNTALFGGVSQGAAEIRKHVSGDYVHRILLLSDGLANVGPSTPEDLGRLGKSLAKEGVSVSTIGVGTDYNEDLMAALARESDGNTYFVESSRDLPRIFAAELGDVLSVAAQDVSVTITFPDGVAAMAFIGREGRIQGQEASFHLRQLYGSQEKYALLEVQVPAGTAGQSLELARVQLSYKDALTRKQEQTDASARIRYSSRPEEVTASVNPEVKTEYQLNRNALAEEKAIRLADEGRNREAAAVLKQSAEETKGLMDTMPAAAPQLMQAAEDAASQADAIEHRGMDKVLRKSMRSRSYQQMNQQQSK